MPIEFIVDFCYNFNEVVFLERNLIKSVISCFDTAIVDLDALDNYYESTRDIINQKKYAMEEEYNIALKISTMLDEVYSKDIDGRQEELEKINDNKIQDDIRVKDVIDVFLVEDNSSIQFSLKDGYKNKKFSPVYARKKMMIVQNQEDIFVRSILSNIIIIFEQYLSFQYTNLVVYEPKKYFGNKTINVSELLDKDIPTIISQEIKNEVDSNMFDSIKALDRIYEKSGIDLDRYIAVRKEFEEIYYRRNLFVHNDGVVNELYLSKVDEKYKENIKMGHKLICDDFYLQNAILVIKKIITSLHCEMLRYFDASQDEYDEVANYGFEALNKKQYSLAEYIYGILKGQKKFDIKCKLMYKINYINALKQQGQDVQSLLETIDVSVATDDYKIAKECLLNNHKGVYDMLIESYPRSFCAIMIRDWPIFINFRESEYYQKFVDEHKEDFDRFVFE